MTAPYLLVADLHNHAWSAFATADETGLNSRLKIQLDELLRAATELKKRGGKLMIVAGDIFHVRGSITPEVFNPTHAMFERIAAMGIEIIFIPGNHDLTGKETTRLGNAIQTLGAIKGITVETEPVRHSGIFSNPIAFIPWCGTKDKLRAEVAKFKDVANTDLILHVGIDGMLDNVPATGLSAAEVASWGFKRVFAGDYHNHRVAEGGKVISIGALTHQQWGDIGSKAGFLFVYPDRVEYQASHAPSFVELTGADDERDFPIIVDGNYVRIRGMKLSDADIKKFRGELMDIGAKGVTFQVTREEVAIRGTSTVGKAATLDESVDKYIDGLALPEAPAVKAICVDVLNEVRSVAA